MKKLFTYAFVMLMSLTAVTTLSSCEVDDQYEADLLISGDWQGYLGEFYRDRWGLSGNTYETVMHFEGRGAGSTSGLGYEVDYDTRSPYRDYAYCEFQWSIVAGKITLLYDDSAWTPVYIYDYRLNSRYFRGYMDDGSRRSIQFDFENVVFNDWARYRNGGSWDYRYARAAQGGGAAAPSVVPYINNGKSIRSGVFAQ